MKFLCIAALLALTSAAQSKEQPLPNDFAYHPDRVVFSICSNVPLGVSSRLLVVMPVSLHDSRMGSVKILHRVPQGRNEKFLFGEAKVGPMMYSIGLTVNQKTGDARLTLLTTVDGQYNSEIRTVGTWTEDRC